MPSHRSPPKSPSQENKQHATGIQVIDISSDASESSDDEMDRYSIINSFARHDEVERDPARRDLAAYDRRGSLRQRYRLIHREASHF